MDRRRLWQRIRKAWIILGLSATALFVVWSLIAYRASATARAAIVSDAAVAVDHDGGIWAFTPTRQDVTGRPALVFFPGSLVDPVAYAPLMRAAASAGFPAYLIELPKRGAFGGADDPALDARLALVLARPEVAPRWIVAGHSRGAVVATRVAAARPVAGLAGLVLIGTSHPRDVDLSTLSVPVTKVVGTRDGLASTVEVEANRARLPPSTKWIWVEGGNHSRFGWYGFQPGDRRATVPASAQRDAMIRAVVDALNAAAPGASAN